jgi:intein/homing endonuclease/uncharacterized coiled-coil protein SlyX
MPKQDLDILKKPHSQSSYSKKMLSDLIQCEDDPVFFIRNFAKIQHPLKGCISFEPHPFQLQMVNNFRDFRFNIAMVCRQGGKTTVAAAFILWKAMFCADTCVLIVANTYKQALEIMDRIRFMYESCPDHIRAGTTEYNKGTISFDNGSKIVSRATTPSAGRGLSITLLYADEFAFTSPNISRDFWTSVQPTLSCVAKDTLVLTDQGYVEIQKLHEGKNVGDYFEFDGLRTFGKNGIEDVSHGYVSPHSDTLIVQTEKGYKVEVTKHHPLYALRGIDAGMVRADELSTGDALRISYGMNVFGNNHKLEKTSCKELTPEFGYILGGMIAEGWITRTLDTRGRKRNMISVSNIDPFFRNAFLNNKEIVPFRIIPSNPQRLLVTSEELVKLFEEVGFKSEWKCDTKQVPFRIFGASKEIQREFLRGYFDGDGTTGGDTVNVTSTSRKLLHEVQLMLNNFGILSIINFHHSAEKQLQSTRLMPNGKRIMTAKDSYVLKISAGQRLIFEKEIGFGIPRKRDQLRDLIEKRKDKTESSTFRIRKSPEIIDLLLKIMKNSKKTHKWFEEHKIHAKGFRNPKGFITHKSIKKLRALIVQHNLPISGENSTTLDELFGPFIWDRIKSITPSTNQTYDFTVPETHSFLQNGILGSNTGGSCIITSTPKSDVDQFSEIWKGAVDDTDDYGNLIPGGVGSNNFRPLSATWRDIPGRDDEWAAPFRNSLGPARFAQEFENQFVTDDETLINPLVMNRIKLIDPAFFVGTVKWFKEPEPNKIHIVGLDPSVGTGHDYSAIQVFQLPEMIQVAEWQHNMTDARGQVRILLSILKDLKSMMLENPEQNGEPELFWTVENNTIGEAVLMVIQDTGEERFPGMMVSEKKKKGTSKRFRKGLLTDNRKKLSACARMKVLVESGRMTLCSRQLVKELKSFVAVGNSFKAKPGEHDDLTMAALLCVRMIERVTGWMAENQVGDMRERITDDEIEDGGIQGGREPMPMDF